MTHNRYYIYTLLLILSFSLLHSCQDLPLQTVESGELLLDEKDPSYKFSRNQESSIDIQEPQYLEQGINDLGVRFFNQAYLNNQSQLDRAMELYKKGWYGYAAYDYIAISEKNKANREAVIQEIDSLIKAIAEVSGFYSSNPTLHRRRDAKEGSSGLISNKLGTELVFVNNKGVVASEVFRYMTFGVIAMDQIFNVHLDKNIILNEQIILDHEHQKLLPGQNYTELEHHWDLAYGYYKYFWRPLAKGNGIPELRGSLRELDLAFTLGRTDINYHLYSELPKYVEKIRKELAKVLLIKAKKSLIGGNTISNLKEDMVFAFLELSRGYAFLYSLTFINDNEGNPYMNYQEVKGLQEQLLGKKGFWERERLLSDEATVGSLKAIEKILNSKLDDM